MKKQDRDMLALLEKLQAKHGVRFMPMRTGMVRDGDRYGTLIKNFDTLNGIDITKFVIAVPSDSEIGRSWTRHYNKPAKRRKS